MGGQSEGGSQLRCDIMSTWTMAVGTREGVASWAFTEAELASLSDHLEAGWWGREQRRGVKDDLGNGETWGPAQQRGPLIHTGSVLCLLHSMHLNLSGSPTRFLAVLCSHWLHKCRERPSLSFWLGQWTLPSRRPPIATCFPHL